MARQLPGIAPPILTQALLLTVVEQLKMPLMQIARSAELAQMQQVAMPAPDVQVTADAAMQLLDNYILGVRLTNREVQLDELEPVTVASVLYSAGQRLLPIAKAYGVQLDVEVEGKYGPVMAHRRGLEAALTSLGYALIEALPAQSTAQTRLQLTSHRCRYGIVAGVYCETEQLTAAALRTGRQLIGQAKQPLGAVSHTSGAGIFVADAILQAMQSELTVSRHKRLYGLGTVLPLNPQLQLV